MKMLPIVVKKGAMQINNAIIYKQEKNICAVIVDMKSKRGEISAIGSDEKNIPDICISSVQSSLYLNPKAKKGDITTISFPSLKNWNIFTCDITKYTIHICFIKNEI